MAFDRRHAHARFSKLPSAEKFTASGSGEMRDMRGKQKEEKEKKKRDEIWRESDPRNPATVMSLRSPARDPGPVTGARRDPQSRSARERLT